MEAGLLDESAYPKGEKLVVRTDPITDTYAVEPRPFARGKFASVRRCRHLATGREFAAKSMRKRRRAQDVRHEILHEAHVLRLSSAHPRIVRMHEVYETPSEIVLVLELVPGGELQRVLDDEEVVEEREASVLLRQILDGVAFLHRHNIAHLDLKPQNLLLTGAFPGGEVKLCDFGISRLITKGIEIREIVGTPDYVAPEVLHYEPISLPTDMWSLGVLTYVLLSGHSPFGGDSRQETFCNITRGALEFPPDLFAHVSPDAIDFIRRLLVRDPRERMTAEECLSHKWLAGGGHPSSDIHLTLSPPEGATRDSEDPPPSDRKVQAEAPQEQPNDTTDSQVGNNSLQNGTVGNNSLQNGTVVNNSLQKGIVGNNSLQNGIVGNNSLQNGTEVERDRKLEAGGDANMLYVVDGEKRLLCSSDTNLVLKSDDIEVPQESVHSSSPLSPRNSYRSLSPKVARTAFCQSQLTSGADMDLKLDTEVDIHDTQEYVHKSPQLQQNASPKVARSVVCKSGLGELDMDSHSSSVQENGHKLRESEKLLPEPVHNTKSPLLQHNGFKLGKSPSPKIARLSQSVQKTTTNIADVDLDREFQEKNRLFSTTDENESPLLQHAVDRRLSKSPSPKVAPRTVFSHSVVHRTSETFVVKSSSSTKRGDDEDSATTVQQESSSKSRSVVVAQFEGMSKRIAFSEEIIVDERVGMVY